MRVSSVNRRWGVTFIWNHYWLSPAVMWQAFQCFIMYWCLVLKACGSAPSDYVPAPLPSMMLQLHTLIHWSRRLMMALPHFMLRHPVSVVWCYCQLCLCIKACCSTENSLTWFNSFLKWTFVHLLSNNYKSHILISYSTRNFCDMLVVVTTRCIHVCYALRKQQWHQLISGWNYNKQESPAIAD